MKEIVILVDKPNIHKIGIGYSLEPAFKNLNIPVNLISFNIDYSIYRILKYIPILRYLYLKTKQKEIIEFLTDKKPEIIFVVKGYFLLPETIKKIKKLLPNTNISCFNPDDPFNKNIGSSNKWIRKSIPHFHNYFIWSRELIKKLKELYKIDASYMPFAVDKTYIDNILKKEEIKEIFEVSFVGNADEIRLQFIKNLIFEKNKRKSKINIHLFGSGWEKLKSIDVIIHKPVLGDEYYKTILQSKININILRDQNKNSINMRTFEVAGCAKFLLHENSEEAKLIFEENLEMVYFYNVSDCYDKIERYLNDHQREKIGENAYIKIVKNEFTYEGLCKIIMEDNKIT